MLLITIERMVAILLLLAATIFIYRRESRQPLFKWRECICDWLGCLALTLIAAQWVPLLFRLVWFGLSGLFHSRWTVADQYALRLCPVVGSIAAAAVFAMSEGIRRFWAEKKNYRAGAELFLGCCLCLGSLAMFGTSWLYMETVFMPQVTTAKQAQFLWLLGLPPALLWLPWALFVMSASLWRLAQKAGAWLSSLIQKRLKRLRAFSRKVSKASKERPAAAPSTAIE